MTKQPFVLRSGNKRHILCRANADERIGIPLAKNATVRNFYADSLTSSIVFIRIIGETKCRRRRQHR